MRIALINPYIKRKDLFYGFMIKIGSRLPPLGLAYIASYLEQFNHELIIFDNCIEKYDLKTLTQKVEKFNPEVIGITSISTQLLYTIITAKYLKKQLENVKIVVGGPHASASPTELLEFCEEIDYIIKGEGEIGFKILLDKLKANENQNTVPGITYRNNKGDFVSNKAQIIEDINTLPFPARHLLPMDKYKPSLTNYNTLPSRSLITSRGCPYNCSFCSKIYCGKVRYNDEQTILKEILLLKNNYNAKELIYWDDCFTFNQVRLLKLFKLLQKNDLNLPWMSMARVDNMSKKFLLEAKKNDCWKLGFGIESGDPDVLRKFNKGINLKQAQEIITFCRKIGIETRIFLMIGTPYDTRDSILRTIEIAKKMDPDVVQFSYFVPFPETKDFNYVIKNFPSFNYQYYFKDVYPDFHNLDNLVFIPNGLKEEELKKLHALAYFNYYFRFKYFIKRLRNMHTSIDLYKNLTISFSLIIDIIKKFLH